MACACKSNNSVKKQVTQVKHISSTNNTVKKSTPNTERKQIVIRRPAR
jgi:hypothetical protein